MAQSALATMDSMNVHHGYGLGAATVGTVSGFGSSVLLGLVYGKYRDHWYGQWMPAFFAAAGKLGALGLFLGTKGRVHIPVVALNDMGQAGVNALGLDLGVKLGLKWAGKQLVVQDDKTALAPGATRIAGELPPADPNRSLENISVEDLANLR